MADTMNRREALSAIGRYALGAMAAGNLGGAVSAAPESRCAPFISGPLWWFDPYESTRWGESGWRDELDQHRGIGFDLLWILNSQTALDQSGDSLKTILDLCARRKVQVILDTGTAPGIYYENFSPQLQLEACGKHIKRIAEQFAGHPAFYAWYIPHEIYMVWGKEVPQWQKLFGGLVELCKKAADLPVTVSPFFILDRTKVFGDFRFNEPDEYRDFWAKMIRKTGIDVIMLQDSGEHFSYVTNEQRRPMLRAMRDACRESGARFWGNVETAEFECPSIEEYVRRYGRVHHSTVKNAPWRQVPIERLKGKLELAAEYAERIVTWGYREFCRPDLSPAAKKWYDDYRAYYASRWSCRESR